MYVNDVTCENGGTPTASGQSYSCVCVQHSGRDQIVLVCVNNVLKSFESTITYEITFNVTNYTSVCRIFAFIIWWYVII